ncbi:tyrosine-protein phosphatase [Companilactobacillus allii]|uniref:Protein tyrosine phosphatase n=1 Tax=Companilactobacillus allii TaxID=1847728 RepID=A0A1P8Q151_9LACO|nr:tyrosine-protein phosphatase [Companilactobacillus allii]APX71555.1 hypothetical protein BTM29_02820 [Companilactobacillus allii]USQ68637.1 tyrosine-protein phosphatase [Companilactobacillus allii]
MSEFKNNRLIQLDGTFNTRDLGGYKTEDGRMVKWGRLYRSDDLYTLTPADVQWFVDNHLTTIIDFRNINERINRPDKKIPDTEYYVLSPDDDTAAMASADLKSDKRKIDKLIARKKQGTLDLSVDGLKESMIKLVRDPKAQELYRHVLDLHIARLDAVVLQHCRGGKDRTGYGSALVLFALGVSEQDVIKDYMLTAKYNSARNARRMAEYEQYTDDKVTLQYLANAMSTRKEVIDAGISTMKLIADTPLGYIENVLGFNKQDINKLRKIYLIN